jgi:hypothetical protein
MILRWSQVLLSGVLTLGAAVLLIACGSDDGGSSTAMFQAKGQFLKMGNLACEKRLKEKDEVIKSALAELPPSELSKPSPKTLEALGRSLLQPIRKLTGELKELPAPSSEEDAAKKVTQLLEDSLKRAQAEPGRLLQTNPFVEAGEAARAYGLDACKF